MPALEAPRARAPGPDTAIVVLPPSGVKDVDPPPGGAYNCSYPPCDGPARGPAHGVRSESMIEVQRVQQDPHWADRPLHQHHRRAGLRHGGPGGVTIHSQRMWMADEVTPENTDRMNADVEQAARYLATARVDLVAYVCTAGSFYRGLGYDEEILRLMEEAAGVPAVATAPAVAEALRHLGVTDISVATPYPQWENERLLGYYQAAGFRVLNVEGEREASVAGAQGICDRPPESALEFACKVCLPEAEALFCSCTAWRTLEVVAEMEKRTGKPVVTANQATIWAAFSRLGITQPRQPLGSLLESLAAAPV